MYIVKVIVIIIIAAFLSLILKQQKSDVCYLLTILVTVLACILGFRSITPLIEYTKGIDGISAEVPEILIKVLGISYLTDFAVTVCRDMGENSLAAGADFCGKAEILLLSLPLFSQLIDICTKLLN